MDIECINFGEEQYPRLLNELADMPKRLYSLGDLKILERPCIGIVGTRRCSAYGENQAFKLARELSRQGFCIVSGLAYGVDAAAHKGALEGRGGTVAVIAQGLPEIGPARNRGLARRILQSGGLILSEKEPGRPVLKHEYLFRNRIISGVSLGVVIIEAAYRSGALNTANHALEQNRDVMALPGRATDPQSAGTNLLIKRGACLISNAKDIADCLNLSWETVSPIGLEGMEAKLFASIRAKPASAAELGELFEGQLKELYSALSRLELKGLIRRSSDLRYAVCGG